MDFFEIVSSIYDCAANPQLWSSTLNSLRDYGNFAYVMVGYMDSSSIHSGFVYQQARHSDWDDVWMQRLQRQLANIPHLDRLFAKGIDVPWLQLEYMTETEFHETGFYREWVMPQGLRDGMNTVYLSRQDLQGVMVMTRHEGQPLIGEQERRLAAMISPHVRRAIAVNDLTDKGQLALALHRKVLDALSVAVYVLGAGGRLVFTNAAGDQILSEGDLLRKASGRLVAANREMADNALEAAVERGIRGDQTVGISGIGVPLFGKSGDRAAAYVLPISGKDLRGDLGNGFCAVFIARRSEQLPMAIEVLRTLFDLTPTEAKVTYATSLGDSPDAIARSLGSTVDTIRFHLKNSYQKVDVSDKTALAAKVHQVLPPVMAPPESDKSKSS